MFIAACLLTVVQCTILVV